MPGTVRFADAASPAANPDYITGDDVESALEDLRRRDNIDDFVAGLVRIEVFPYPDGAKTAKPAQMAFQKVAIRPTILDKLTKIVYLARTASQDFVKITTKLEPDGGPGCYSEDRVVILQTTAAPVAVEQARALRSALFARYEWVISKVADINELRRRHLESPDETPDDEDHVDHEELSEEPDPEILSEDDDSADEDQIEEENEDIVFPLDQSLQEEIDKKIKEMVSGKEVLIIDALGKSHGMEDGHTDRTGRVKAAPAPPQGTKRSAEIDPVVHKCPLSKKKARIEALADIVGAITMMLPGLANGEGECCFEAIVEDFNNVAWHIKSYAALEKGTLDIPASDEIFVDDDDDSGEDSDEVNSWYEVHGSQTYSSQTTNRRQASKEL
ncbi:hypothetical protein MBLNU457_g0847t1 [Dothideomycetes sp. NU457]